jgi:hypothetical protein
MAPRTAALAMHIAYHYQWRVYKKEGKKKEKGLFALAPGQMAWQAEA